MITQVTYERVFNLGSYESERISATVTVEDTTEAAYGEARLAVAEEHARTVAARQQVSQPSSGATYTERKASQNQQNFIAFLIEKLGWTSEEFAAAAGERGFKIADITTSEASVLIDWLKTEQKQEQIVSGWATRVVTAGNVAPTEDIPF